MSSLESIKAQVYFSEMSVIYFCLGFSCGPYYQGVPYSKMYTRQEFTVLQKVGS